MSAALVVLALAARSRYLRGPFVKARGELPEDPDPVDEAKQGFSTVIRTSRGVVSEEYAGLAQVREGGGDVAVSRTTMFMWASVSKVVTTMVALRMWETILKPQGIGLWGDLTHLLPFTIQSPQPVCITLGHLMQHRSGILDDDDFLDDAYTYGSDDPVSYEGMVRSYLTKDGPFSRNWYDPLANFGPAGVHSYSNAAFTLLGYIIERVTSRPFKEYCYAEVFDRLGLERQGEMGASWELKDFDWDTHSAFPNGTGTPFSWPGGCDGSLWATGMAMSEIVQTIANKGVAPNGNRILSEETWAEWTHPKHFRSNVHQHGLSLAEDPMEFRVESPNQVIRTLGHRGAEAGVSSTVLVFMPPAEGGEAVVTVSVGNTDWVRGVAGRYTGTWSNCLLPGIAEWKRLNRPE